MTGPIDLRLPFTGRWRVRHSPADRVPSHGTALFATSYAIDFVPVDADGRSAPISLTSLLRPEPPERFVGFGRPVLAPVAGTVVAAHDGEPDHAAYRGLPSVGYAATQAGRARAGFVGLAGNHVVLRTADGVHVALCHLQRGSVVVSVGATVGPGAVLGACGNSGNSTEPHLHLQAMTGPDPRTAAAVPITFGGGLPRNGTVVDGGA